MKDVKVIMLDMDGVVNSSKHVHNWINYKREEITKNNPNIDKEELFNLTKKAYSEEFVHCEELVFPDLAEYIKRICDETDCYIVWSSTWRKLERYQDIEKAREMFKRRNLPGDRLIAYTPQIGMAWGGICRGSEIACWVRDNTEYNVIKCAVIDDRKDAGFNLTKCCKFFQTFSWQGITRELTNEIIDFLNAKE